MSRFRDYVPQPLTFYMEQTPGERIYQTRYQEHCQGEAMYKFVVVANIEAPGLRIPPFQLKRDKTGASISAFTLRSTDGLVTVSLSTAHFSLVDLDNPATKESVIFGGNVLSPAMETVPPKDYYLTVSDGANTWYSEVFIFEDESSIDPTFPAKCSTMQWARLEYSSACIVSETINSDGPSFLFLLPVSISLPEYKYSVEDSDDGQGGKQTLFRRLDKRWQFFITAPEHVADALTAVQMMTTVIMSFENGDFVTCRDIEVSVDWQTTCLAKITFSFTADLLTRTSCCG